MDTAYVVAGGQRYDIWQSIEVSRNYYPPISYAMLVVAEMNTGTTWATLQLAPGDPAQVFLDGQLVIDGHVFLRQSTYDSESHAVQIGIFAYTQNVMPSTTDANPGQYKNQTLQQIASTVFGKVGVNFQLLGSPSGADKVFPRVSEHVGESRYEFVKRLAAMRNIHLIDDGQKTIQGVRGGSGGGPAAALVEGQNILKARLILRNNEFVERFTTVGQNFGNNSAYDNTSNPSATGTVPGTPMGRTGTGVAPQPGDAQDMQLLNNHTINWYAYDTVDGAITIPGWLMDDGTLWITQLTSSTGIMLVTVQSPMLIPTSGGQMVFAVKGVSHRQNDQEGTVTEVFLCRQDGLGLGTGEAFGDPAAPIGG